MMIFLLIILGVAFSKVIPINKHIYVKQAYSCTPSSDNSGNTVYIGNCNFNELYTINFGIGTPAQNFNLQFDTGSNFLWVQTTSSNTTGFNQSQSTTVFVSNNTFQIDYLKGQVKGYTGNDVVSLANTNINNQLIIGFAYYVANQSFPDTVYGIVGMGFSNINNFLDKAWQNKQISSNTFTLSLNNVDRQSFMYYDDIPSQILANTYYISVYNQSYWSGKVNYFTSDELDLSDYAAGLAIFDSGTTYIQINNALWDAIFEKYLTQNCIYDQLYGQTICNCPIEFGGNQEYPTFAITLDGIQIYLTPVSYFKYLDKTQNQCYYLIYGGNQQQILLGDILFHQYNITFSKQAKQVGFQGVNLTYGLNLTKNNFFIYSQFALLGIIGIIILYGLFLLIIYRPCCNTNHYFRDPKLRLIQKETQIPEITNLNMLMKDRNSYIPSKNNQYELQSSVR